MFQFQYGAIKSVLPENHRERVDSFQFQYGAIKSYVFNLQIPNPQTFQFQYGAIKSQASHLIQVKDLQVSIPIWCD